MFSPCGGEIVVKTGNVLSLFGRNLSNKKGNVLSMWGKNLSSKKKNGNELPLLGRNLSCKKTALSSPCWEEALAVIMRNSAKIISPRSLLGLLNYDI